MALPLLTRELVRELDGVHTAFDRDRIGGLARLPGNPYGVEIRAFGRATAFAARAIGDTYYNKVLGVGVEEVDLVPELAAFFAEHGAGCCRVELLPGDLDGELADRLTALGLRHVGFQAGYYGLPSDRAGSLAPGLAIRAVDTDEDLDRFLAIVHAGFELDPSTRATYVERMRYWRELPGWRLHLATVDGEPCAAGLFVARGDLGYLALEATLPGHRRRGCHQALVREGLALAARAGCRLVHAQCDFVSAAARNYERLGLSLAYTKALWEYRAAAVSAPAMSELEPPTPLGRSLLWGLQRASFEAQGPEAWRPGLVPLQATSNPFIARCYAAVIAGLARDLRAAGTLTGPLSVIELGAGTGRFGFYLLAALDAAFAHDGELPVRVVMTDVAERNLSAMAAHPKLAPYVARGVCDFARFDVERPGPLALRVSGQVIDVGAGAPVVAIANYLFDSVPADAIVAVDGVARELRLALAGPTTRDAPLDDPVAALAALAWRLDVGPPRDDGGDPILETIVREAATLEGRVTLLPVAGFATLDFLARAGGGRLLLLTSDKGHRDPAMRPAGLEDRIVRHGGCVSLPVDFAALARWFELRGGFASPAIQRHEAFYTGAFGLGLDAGALPRTLDALDEMERFGPGDYQRLFDLAAAGPTPSPEHLLTLLRLASFDPRLVIQFAEPLAAALRAAPPAAVDRDLVYALERAGDLDYPTPGRRGGMAALGTLLFHLGEPARAAARFERALDETPDDAEVQAALARCRAELGRRSDPVDPRGDSS